MKGKNIKTFAEIPVIFLEYESFIILTSNFTGTSNKASCFVWYLSTKMDEKF